METVVENRQKNNLPVSYKVVADIIPVGKSNSILLRDISSITGIIDNRNLYEIIEQLIVKHGYPIVASRKGERRGYYLPADERELDEAKTTLGNTIKSLEKRYKSVIENYYKQ